LCQPIWDTLGVRRVALLPAGAIATPTESITTIFETEEGLHDTLRHLPDCALLLRPDHYVAAVVPLAGADAMVASIEQLVASTWQIPGRSGSQHDVDEPGSGREHRRAA